MDQLYSSAHRDMEACLTNAESTGGSGRLSRRTTGKVTCCRILFHESLFPWTSETRCEPIFCKIVEPPGCSGWEQLSTSFTPSIC